MQNCCHPLRKKLRDLSTNASSVITEIAETGNTISGKRFILSISRPGRVTELAFR